MKAVKGMALAASPIRSVDLGQLQAELEKSTKELKSAQKVFTEAEARMGNAEAGHRAATISLEQGLKALRSQNTIDVICR